MGSEQTRAEEGRTERHVYSVEIGVPDDCVIPFPSEIAEMLADLEREGYRLEVKATLDPLQRAFAAVFGMETRW